MKAYSPPARKRTESERSQAIAQTSEELLGFGAMVVRGELKLRRSWTLTMPSLLSVAKRELYGSPELLQHRVTKSILLRFSARIWVVLPV